MAVEGRLRFYETVKNSLSSFQYNHELPTKRWSHLCQIARDSESYPPIYRRICELEQFYFALRLVLIKSGR